MKQSLKKVYHRVKNKAKHIKNKIIPQKQPIVRVIDPKQKIQIRLRQKLDRLQTANFYYYIDIVGTCNLRCPSCPVGNYEDADGPVGLMSLEKYTAILNKIEFEHPNEKVFIDLYNWGEPGLHKNLSEIIRITKEKGFGVGISTNLNAFPDMVNVIKQSPDYIRISLSGYFNENYKKTHRRGDINIVKSNMHLLRHKLDLYKSKTIIQVGFHIYKDNFKEDFPKMRSLCDDLGFIFAPTLASLMPVEKSVQVVDGNLNGVDKDLLDNLVVSTEKRVELLSQSRSKYKDCQFRQLRTTINFDGSVPLCCASFEEDQLIAKNFLEVPRKELQMRKYRHPFCRTCQARSLDMVYVNVESHLVEAEAVKVLGPDYQEFLTDWSTSLDPVMELNGEEVTAQTVFDTARSHQENGDIQKAKELYAILLKEFPRHSEALYKLGIIHEHANEKEQALSYYQDALAIWPGYQAYVDAIQRLKGSGQNLVNA